MFLIHTPHPTLHTPSSPPAPPHGVYCAMIMSWSHSYFSKHFLHSMITVPSHQTKSTSTWARSSVINSRNPHSNNAEAYIRLGQILFIHNNTKQWWRSDPQKTFTVKHSVGFFGHRLFKRTFHDDFRNLPSKICDKQNDDKCLNIYITGTYSYSLHNTASKTC